MRGEHNDAPAPASDPLPGPELMARLRANGTDLATRAADALAAVYAQMETLNRRLAQEQAQRAAAELSLIETQSQMAVLRATTGCGHSQW